MLDNQVNHKINKIMVQTIDYKYSDTTAKIIGAAMKVHRYLGNGFQEVIYQRCLEIEFNNTGLAYEREKEQIIYYEGVSVGMRRVDFLVEGKILVELKAVVELENVHLAQAKNYLEAFNLEVGLLLNFGATSLQFKRLIKKHQIY
jgi:GxxExxY protein